MTSGVIRWSLYLDWVLSHFVKHPIKRDVRHLLWMSLYQVLFMKKAFYHVVNEAVEHAKKEKGQGVANFVNAVLRRAIAETARLPYPADPLSRLSVEFSFPEWLIKRWYARFGEEETKNLLSVLNRTPEFALRVNLARITREEVMERLRSRGVEAKEGKLLQSALYVDRLGPVLDDDLFKAHLVHVQDETSQMAALTLAPGRNDAVLDACAGLGTKTEHIKEAFPEARVAAMDIDKGKLHSTRLTRCVVQGDALKNPFKRGCFDSILLDAPCSSLGIIRKHPEIKWRRGEKDIQAFGSRQFEMIKTLSGSLKQGGVLVYSVCSFEREETIDVVEQLKKKKVFMADRDPFLSLPQKTGLDGFFIARLKKL